MSSSQTFACIYMFRGIHNHFHSCGERSLPTQQLLRGPIVFDPVRSTGSQAGMLPTPLRAKASLCNPSGLFKSVKSVAIRLRLLAPGMGRARSEARFYWGDFRVPLLISARFAYGDFREPRKFFATLRCGQTC